VNLLSVATVKLCKFINQDGGGRRLEKNEKSPYIHIGLTARHDIWHGNAV